MKVAIAIMRDRPLRTSHVKLEPAFNIVLVRPEIPQNSGSVARLTAATKTLLHLVGPLGYSLADRYLKRAGLDYWPFVDLRTYTDWDGFDTIHQSQRAANFKYFSTHGDEELSRGGISPRRFPRFRQRNQGARRGIPCDPARRYLPHSDLRAGVRSLNLANAVSIVLYEALRQSGLLTDA